jgi:hypothetical protein
VQLLAQRALGPHVRLLRLRLHGDEVLLREIALRIRVCKQDAAARILYADRRRRRRRRKHGDGRLRRLRAQRRR